MAERANDRQDDWDEEEGRGTPCPRCGSRYQSAGPWPWYLGTVGAILCRAVVCDDCGHEFDAKKPQADLTTRKRNLAVAINGVGCLGIVVIVGGLVVYLRLVMAR